MRLFFSHKAMEIIIGKVGIHWDTIAVVINGKELFLEIDCLEERSYTIGEEIQGVIIEGKFKSIS